MGAALHAGEWFADVKSEGGVERERAVVEGSLHQPDSSGAALVRAIHGGLHEFAAHSEILRSGIDGDGTDAADDGALVKAIAADDAASLLRHHAIEVRVGEHHCEQIGGGFGPGKSQGKPWAWLMVEKAL